MSKFKITADMATDIMDIKEKMEDKNEVTEIKKDTDKNMMKVSEKKTVVKVKTEKKHAGGRPNTRGEFKVLNIAVPMETYEKLKEVSNGNMTYYINNLLRENLR